MLEAILKDIIGFSVGYAHNACLVATIVALAGALIMICLKKYFVLAASIEAIFSRKIFLKKVLQLFFLAAYIYIVIGITIFSRSESGIREASFQLFRTFRNTFVARKQIYENIIMFVPYAILLYGLARPFRRLRFALLMGIGSSLLIEIAQWVTWTGCFELDDILTNTIGMVVGYLICLAIEKVYKRIKKTP